MEDTHANPLYFYDNPSPFVTIWGDPTGQESQPLSSFGYTDPFHAWDAEEEEARASWPPRRRRYYSPLEQEEQIKGREETHQPAPYQHSGFVHTATLPSIFGPPVPNFKEPGQPRTSPQCSN